MKAHTTNFKNQIQELGREIDSIITFGDTALGIEELNAVTPSFQGGLLKSVMKQLDIDSNVDIPIGTELNYQFGVKVNDQYEYLDFGNYIVYSSEKQEDTLSYKIVCYDKMLKSMVDYEDLALVYPITIRDYLNEIAQFMGIEFASNNETFTNYNREIPDELFLKSDGGSLEYTFRDVLDQLAQVVAGTICINSEDKLEVRYVNETNDTIDENFLKDVNVNFGEKYGPINSIVLSRSGESDNVYIQNEASIEANGLHELKIKDNQIMNFNDRSQYLEGILSRLNGLEFYINDFTSTGVCYYDLYDKYNVQVNGETYSCIMFNDEILVTQGLQENIYTDKPEETETDYKKADKVDRQINSAYIIVDKRIGEIESKINSTSEVVGDLESSINYFSVELAQNSLTVATKNNNSPITSKTYEIPYYGYFKGQQVIPNVNIEGRHDGIKVGSNSTSLTFEVEEGVVIEGITNNYTITFTYFYGGKNYTTIKNFAVILATQGSDGTSVNILGSYDSYEELKQAHPTGSIGDAYIVQGNMFVWNAEEQDWVDVGDIQGPAGKDGQDGTNGKSAYQIWLDNGNIGTEEEYLASLSGTSAYFYVRYSANANGSDMTTAPTSTTKYMGTASTTSPTAPTSTSAYTWVEIKGKDGTNGSPGQAGENGKTSYLHIKYSDDGLTFTEEDDMFALGERPSSWIGQYTDFVEADSTNFDDYSWYKFTEDIDGTINEMKSDIKKNETDLENTKQNLIDELDKKANAEELKVAVNEIKTLQNSNSIVTTIIEDIQVNGVSQVKQENVFTLNKDGFLFEETGAKTKAIINNKGVDVLDTQGNGNDLLYAGYVDEEKADSNEKFKDYEGQTIVYSNNMIVDNYLAIGSNSRIEDYLHTYENGTEEEATGVFWTGG